MARLDAIPDQVRTHFSKRTLGGEEAARAYAKELGLDWDALSPQRRAGLLKAGTQGTAPGLEGTLREKLRKDDMADFADWRRQAETLGWNYAGVETHGPPMPPLSPEERLQKAYEAALPWLEKELEHRAVIGVGDVRAAALRGLIAHGIEKTADVDAVTERFMAEGVRQHGQETKLYWQDVEEPRQAKLTTALHVSQERTFITLAKEAAADRSDALNRDQVRQAIQQSGLTFSGEQAEAIHRLGEGGRLGVTDRRGGYWKNDEPSAAGQCLAQQQRDVHGIALAWRQADELVDAGIPQQRVKALSVFEQATAKGEIALSSKSVRGGRRARPARHTAGAGAAAASATARLPHGVDGRSQATRQHRGRPDYRTVAPRVGGRTSAAKSSPPAGRRASESSNRQFVPRGKGRRGARP